MRPIAVGAALVTGAAIVGLAAGPLHVQSRPWNAVTFSGPMQGASDRLADTTLRFNTFMVTGVGGARQQVWFRADVLIRLPGTVRSSSFQMAYLPSGLRCRGAVTRLDPSDLTAVCRLRTGARRRVDVRWQPSSTTEQLDGTISVRPRK